MCGVILGCRQGNRYGAHDLVIKTTVMCVVLDCNDALVNQEYSEGVWCRNVAVW